VDGCFPDQATVAHDGDPLADLVDLLQMMRDEQERHACSLQSAMCSKQMPDLARLEPCRRLVHDDETAALPKRAGDLEQLPLADGQLAGALVDIDVQAPELQFPRSSPT
jgi:hypothetical protein